MSVKPTLHEIRIFQTTGKMPDSLKKRRKEYEAAQKKAAKDASAKKKQEEAEAKAKEESEKATAKAETEAKEAAESEEPVAEGENSEPEVVETDPEPEVVPETTSIPSVEVAEPDSKAEKPTMDDTKRAIVGYLSGNGIKHNPRDNKETLLGLIE